MLKLALWALMIVTVAGILAAVILILARMIMVAIAFILLAGVVWLVLRTLFKAITRRAAPPTGSFHTT